MEKIAVSACLLGKNCRFDGKCKINQRVVAYLKDKEVFEICPEVMGGLEVPRTPCEIQNNRVIDKNGIDKTKEYTLGAYKSLEIIKNNNIKKVILKSKSPSCGCKQIYDGSFNRTLIDGMGITARILSKENIEIIDSDDI